MFMFLRTVSPQLSFTCKRFTFTGDSGEIPVKHQEVHLNLGNYILSIVLILSDIFDEK